MKYKYLDSNFIFDKILSISWRKNIIFLKWNDYLPPAEESIYLVNMAWSFVGDVGKVWIATVDHSPNNQRYCNQQLLVYHNGRHRLFAIYRLLYTYISSQYHQKQLYLSNNYFFYKRFWLFNFALFLKIIIYLFN